MVQHTFPFLSLSLPERGQIEYEVNYGYDPARGYFLTCHNPKTSEYIINMSGITGEALAEKLALLHGPHPEHISEAREDIWAS